MGAGGSTRGRHAADSGPCTGRVAIRDYALIYDVRLAAGCFCSDEFLQFFGISLHGTRNADTNEKSFARRQITLPDLSVLAQRCIKRTLHQIAFRLPQPGVPMGMALLLDPRTKRAAKNYLQIPDWAQAATGHILEDTKALLRAEHRVMYKALHINEDAEGDAVNSAASSPGRDCSSSSDTELDLLCGEEVLEYTN
ncbi:hypothetical protein V7S43_011442 [Phytophthora oleae]|uniref:PiggyBac transposable element-derived protein domain-containing protein n=1 Tax=Phytophthora oleae TaxID=2107226 RepID=A0ABD3F9K7_9STRA